MWFVVGVAVDDAVADAELGDLACMCACVLEAWGGASGTGVDCEPRAPFIARDGCVVAKRCRAESLDVDTKPTRQPLKQSDTRRVRLRAVGFCLAAVGFGRCNLIGLIGIIGFVSRCPSPTGKGAYPHPHQQSAGRQAEVIKVTPMTERTWCCRRHWCQIGHPASRPERLPGR